MSKPKHKTRNRRLRRTAKQVRKHGSYAKRKHSRKTGRTGTIMTKRLKTLERT
jgi:hypothetical protein